VLTAVLVLLTVAAGFAVDRFVFHGEFVRMAIAEARLIRAGRGRPTSAAGVSPRSFGRR
jgi:hypothetical protein